MIKAKEVYRMAKKRVWILVLLLLLAVGAVLFSVTVAMLSGLYPAIRAMRLSPLNAIRNE